MPPLASSIVSAADACRKTRSARERERGRESVVKITGPLDDEKSRGRIQRRKGGGVMKFAPSLVEALCRATQSIYIYIYILAGDFFD